MGKPSDNLLAIESAISGGSLALFRNGDVVASRAGSESISRAEDLLPNILSLLKEAELSKSDLDRIAVSLGPGSYTGLRIGIAAVMGLTRGLRIPPIGVPLFQALVTPSSETSSMAVVPMGKSDLCFARSDRADSPIVGTIDDLVKEMERAEVAEIRCHTDVYSMIEARFDGHLRATDIGLNLAEYIGTAAQALPPSENLHPIYVQNPRFGSPT